MSVVGCQPELSNPFRVGLTVWPPNEMAYLAAEKALYRGLEIELMDSASPTEYLPGYLEGGFDAAIVSVGAALELVDVDPGHKIVMLIDYSRGADALVARAGIESVEQLKGARIGFDSSPLGGYVLTRLLAVAGLDVGEVVPVPIEGVSHDSAFREGLLDAVVTWQPAVDRLLDEGAHLIVDSRQIPEEILDVLVVRDHVLTDQRAELEAFAAGWFEALELHRRDPQGAAALAEARQHVSVKHYLHTFEGIVMLDREANIRLLNDSPGPLLAMLERHRQFLAGIGLLRSDIDVASVIDASIVGGQP